MSPILRDPITSEHEVTEEYRLGLRDFIEMRDLDTLILAVPYKPFLENQTEFIFDNSKKYAILIDVKSASTPASTNIGAFRRRSFCRTAN